MRRLGEFAVACTLVAGCVFDTEGGGRQIDGDGSDDDDDSTGTSGSPITTTIGTTASPATAGTTTGTTASASDETNAVDPGSSSGGQATATTAREDSSSSSGQGDDSATGSSDGGPTGEGGESSSSEETSAGNMCPVSYTELLWAEDAALGGPMQLVPVTGASGSPMLALSDQQDTGTVTFSADVPCPGDYTVWGLVWDYYPGAFGSSDPDSFYVSTTGPEVVWRYGCQTGSETDGLTWQPLQMLDAQPCDTTPVQLSISEAGTTTLTFRNREAGDGGSVVAGISAVLLSSNGGLDPYAEYAP